MSAGRLVSHSPAPGEEVGSVATVAPEDVQAVVDEVAKVQPFWSQLPLVARGRYLLRAAQAIVDELDELGALIPREQGKQRVEALSMELLPTIDALRWIAEAGTRALAEEKLRFH